MPKQTGKPLAVIRKPFGNNENANASWTWLVVSKDTVSECSFLKKVQRVACNPFKTPVIPGSRFKVTQIYDVTKLDLIVPSTKRLAQGGGQAPTLAQMERAMAYFGRAAIAAHTVAAKSAVLRQGRNNSLVFGNTAHFDALPGDTSGTTCWTDELGGCVGGEGGGGGGGYWPEPASGSEDEDGYWQDGDGSASNDPARDTGYTEYPKPDQCLPAVYGPSAKKSAWLVVGKPPAFCASGEGDGIVGNSSSPPLMPFTPGVTTVNADGSTTICTVSVLGQVCVTTGKRNPVVDPFNQPIPVSPAPSGPAWWCDIWGIGNWLCGVKAPTLPTLPPEPDQDAEVQPPYWPVPMKEADGRPFAKFGPGYEEALNECDGTRYENQHQCTVNYTLRGGPIYKEKQDKAKKDKTAPKLTPEEKKWLKEANHEYSACMTKVGDAWGTCYKQAMDDHRVPEGEQPKTDDPAKVPTVAPAK